MVNRSVRVIMNVITNILRTRQYERKREATKKLGKSWRRQKKRQQYAKKEIAHILPQWREKYGFSVIEFKHPKLSCTLHR